MNILILHIKTFSLTLTFIFMLLILKKNVFVDLLKVLCALGSGPNGKIQAI